MNSDETDWRPLAYRCELVAMEFWNKLATIETFCQLAYENLDPKLKDYQRRTQEARTAYELEEGPNESGWPYYGEEEQGIALEAQPVFEARELVGCFALVYLASALDSYSDDLLNDTHLKPMRRQRQKNRGGRISKDEGQKIVATIHVLDEALKKVTAAEIVSLIKEVIRARNDFVHNAGFKKTSSRFIAHGRIAFSNSDLNETLTVLRSLCRTFEQDCKPLSEDLLATSATLSKSIRA